MEIEILPWVHSFRLQMHADLVSFLKTVPRGSKIFLEGVTGSSFDLSERSIDRRISHAGSKDQLFSFLELELLSVRRNFQTMLVDPRIIGRLYNLDRHPYSERNLEVTRLREEAMVRNILSGSSANTAGKVYLIVGMAHARPINDLLLALGRKAKIRTDFIVEKRTIEKLIANPNPSIYLHNSTIDSLRVRKNPIQALEELLGALRKKIVNDQTRLKRKIVKSKKVPKERKKPRFRPI